MADHDMRDRLDEIVRLLSERNAVAAEKLAAYHTLQAPDAAEGWFLLGTTQHFQKKRDAALSAFDHALAIHPAHVQALRAKAAVLSEMSRFDDAVKVCKQALKLFPDDADLITNLGTVLEKTGHLEEALEQFNLALFKDKHHLYALLNRGALLMRLHRLEEALAHNRHFTNIYPDFADAYYNLSETLFGLNRHKEALSICEAGLGIAPRHARLRLNRGIALAVSRRFEESQAELAQAQILEPNLLRQLIPEIEKIPAMIDVYASAEMVYLEANAEALQGCFWAGYAEFPETLQQFIEKGTPSGLALNDKRLAFTLLGLSVSSRQHLHVLRQISDYVEDVAWLYALPPFRHHPHGRERIRIGYVSPDFRDHPIGHLTKRLYALHDRRKFEIHCYSIVRADDDSVQQEISAGCDHWHDLSMIDNIAAAKKIHEDGIDILIDLAGYTKFARTEIFALRPAPIQVNYLGYPGTMGATFMDYLIGDPVVTPPDHAPYYTEKLALLPQAYQPNCLFQELIAPPPPRSECGLPDHVFVFCGFNQAFKITPEVFKVWMRLLHDVPGSVLWLLQAGPIAEQNLRREAQSRGIDAHRLVFAQRLPWVQHLLRHQHADLMLDTQPYNAHTTASDALRAGVPLITCMGDTFASRVAGSLLQAIGLPELITHSMEDYAKLALDLAQHPEKLQQIRLKLATNRMTHPLFNMQAFVVNLESLYAQMWSSWQSEHPSPAIIRS